MLLMNFLEHQVYEKDKWFTAITYNMLQMKKAK